MPAFKFPRFFFLAFLAAISPAFATAVEFIELEPFTATGYAEQVRAQAAVSEINENLLNDLQNPNTGLSTLSDRVPNLSIDGLGARSYGDVYNLRGIGSTPYFSSPAIVFYIDGVPSGDPYSLSWILDDVESITVLSGPRSTAFGRNAPGGVISIRTRAPSPEHRARGKISYGSYGEFTASFAASGPLHSSRSGYSFRLRHARHDGFIYNPTLGEEADSRKSSGGELQIQTQFNEQWEIAFGVSIDLIDDGAHRIVPLPFSPSASDPYDPFLDTSDLRGSLQIQSDRQFLRLQYAHPDFLFSSVTSRSFWDMDPYVSDFDLSPAPFATSIITQDLEQWTEELRLTSPADDYASVGWLLGLFFLTSEGNGFVDRKFGGFPDLANWSTEESSAAFFAEVDYKATPDLTLTAGIRLDYTEKSLFRSKPPSPFLTIPDINLEEDFTNLSASLTATYQVNEEISVFARLSRAVKPGGFSPYTNDPTLAPHDTETILAWEAGLTRAGENPRQSLNLNAFYYDIQDYQVERSLTQADYVVFNADEVTAYGIEANLTQPVAPLLFFQLTTGLQEIHFDRYTDSVTGVDYAENTPPYTPTYTLRGNLLLELESGFHASLGLTAVGETFFHEDNLETSRRDSYILVDLLAGYQKDAFRIEVYARNMTDEQYVHYILTALAAQSPGEPSHFGLRTSFSF